MNINVQFIEPVEMRYPTCGDYFIDKEGNWQIRVSQMFNSRSMMAVLVHELVEMILAVNRGIPLESIDKFDIHYEQNRPYGDNSEPGDNPKAPYHEEHTFATGIERMMCEALSLTWTEHEQVVNASLE